MKKVFALALSLTTISAVFAQPKQGYNYQSNKDYRYESPVKNDSRFDDKRNAPVYGQNNSRYDDKRTNAVYNSNNNRYDNNRMSDRDRQAEIDRINRDYDRRIADYRNDRRISERDRNNKIQVLEKERNSQLIPFGAGVLVGGILGVLLSR